MSILSSKNPMKMELEDYARRKVTFAQVGKSLRRQLGERKLERCMEVLTEEAIGARNRIIEGMRNSPPIGRRYFKRLNKRGKPLYHIASGPGYPPRVDTGGLVASIGVDVRDLEVEVGSRISVLARKHGKNLNWRYPAFLETGTKKMAARPWLNPVINGGKGTGEGTIKRIDRRIQMVLQRAANDLLRGE